MALEERRWTDVSVSLKQGKKRRCVDISLKQQEESRWSNILPELLQSIASRLPLTNYPVFRGTCKQWHLAMPDCSNIAKFSKNIPWLMLHRVGKNENDTWYLYDHSYPDSCTIWLPHLRGATCVESKAGWLLARRDKQLFFYNPFTMDIIDLPDYPQIDIANQDYTFSSVPTSPDCIIFVVCRINSSTIKVSLCCCACDRNWDSKMINNVDASLGPFDIFPGCNCGDGQCSCKNKSKIYMVDSKKLLSYDFVNEKVVMLELGKRGLGNWEAFGTFQRMKRLHQNEWFHKFGGKGFVMSSCSFNGKIDSQKHIRGFTKEITNDGRTATELCNVKAVWLDPRFRKACE